MHRERTVVEEDLTQGVLSNILKRSWRCSKDKKFRLTLEDLRNLHQLLTKYQQGGIFGEVAYNIYITYEELKAEEKLQLGLFERAFGIDAQPDSIQLYNAQGFILHDSMEASAFGRFRYIYRAKGIRLYWFDNGTIGAYNIYSTIDENGFQYFCDDMNCINIWNNVPDNKSEQDWMNLNFDYDLNDLHIVLGGLVNIKKQYSRDYPLEYMLDPPDVNLLSDFSLSLRQNLWDMVIDIAKEAVVIHDDESDGFLKYLIDLMGELEINPMPAHIFDFYDYSFNKERFQEISELLKSVLKRDCEQEDFTQSLIHVCRKLQEKHSFKEMRENDKNSYLMSLLEERRRDLVFKEQVLKGESAGGKASGEADICVEDKRGDNYAFIEAMILNCVHKAGITSHINRIWKYDTAGLPVNYIVIYYQGNNFKAFIEKYGQFLGKAKLDNELTSRDEIQLEVSDVRVIETGYNRNGRDLNLIHVCVNMHL